MTTPPPETLFAALARLAPGVLYAGLKACNDYDVGLAGAAKAKCPALFVLGRGDTMTPPRSARAPAQAIAGSRTVEIAAVSREHPPKASQWIGSRTREGECRARDPGKVTRILGFVTFAAIRPRQ